MAEEKEQVSIKGFLRKRVAATQTLEFDGLDPIVIRELSNSENEALQTASSVTTISKSGRKVKELDPDKYTDALLVAAVKSPDLNDAELQKFYGALGEPAQALKNMLSMGEFNKLSKAIIKLSGLEETLNDQVGEVKN